MKQKTLLFSWLLAMLFSIVGASPAWATTYKLTQVTSVSAGEKYVFVQSSHAMNNSVSSSALQTTTSYSTTGLTGTETYVWTLESATGGFYLKNVSLNSNQFLNNASSTNVSFGSKSSIWTIAFTNGVALISNKSNSNRFLGYTSSTSYAYKAYATSNLSSYSHDITVYKLEEEVEDFVVTGTSSNNSHGTVSVEGNVITATPTEGYRVSTSTAYTITSGNSNVSNVAQEGNVFTVSATGDCTVQINFEAIPTHTITITSPIGGTLTVKNGEDVVSSGSSVREGTELTIIPEEDSSHKFNKWTATVGNISTNYTDIFTYTVPASDFTLSATFDEVVKYAVNWSVNGNVTTAYYEEDESIVFPDDPADINGMTFVGWYGSTYSNASVAPTYVTEATMGTEDVTYYAVFADVEEEESDDVADAVKAQTLQYDTWSYSGSTTNKTSYRLFGNNAYIRSESFDLSKLMKVIVYGGTFGGSSYCALTIGDGTNTWKTGTLSGTGNATSHEISGGSALSGTKMLYITSNSGDGQNNGLRISKVEIYVKGTNVTYSNYTTSVSALPRPEITMADVVMTWGDDDKNVAPSATISDEAYEGTFSFESDSEDLTVESDGSLSCDVPGIYHVTASIAATAEHQAASKTSTITVNKKDLELTFANGAVQKLITDATYSQLATTVPAAYDGTVSYEMTTNTASATFNTETKTVSFSNTGSVTITATAPATDLYNGDIASYTLTIKTTPTITVSNQTLAYGETYTPSITGGTATITCVPAGLISVEDNVITAEAVGTTTITITTADNDTYVAGEESFTLTVTAPVGSTTKPDASPIVLFNETFNKSNGTGGRDDLYDGNVGTSSLSDKLDETWSIIGSNGASKCIKLGTSSATGTVKTGVVSLTGAGTLSYSAAGWSSGTNTVQVSATGATVSGDVNVTMSNSTWSNYTVNLTEATGSVQLTFSIKRGFLDDVKVTKPGVDISSVTATIPSSGFGTYCCQYPLDLPANNEDYKAYIITAVEGNNVTFTKISGEIKGGVPFILYGTAGNYDLPVAVESETIPSGNMLTGTLAPTYITSETGANYNFGLSGGKFKKLNPGVLPANKAYLSVPKSNFSDGAREFNFIFEDGETTGIESITPAHSPSEGVQAFYDLQGRKVSKPSRGLYIVNGKKVVIK